MDAARSLCTFFWLSQLAAAAKNLVSLRNDRSAESETQSQNATRVANATVEVSVLSVNIAVSCVGMRCPSHVFCACLQHVVQKLGRPKSLGSDRAAAHVAELAAHDRVRV